MTTSQLTAIPDNMSTLDLNWVVRDAKDFALCNGVCLRPRDAASGLDILSLAPITLFPSPFPRRLFMLAKEIQTSVNLLANNVGHDLTFIQSSLDDTVKVDDFTRNLLHVYTESERIGRSQDLNFGLFRTDYMVHSPGDGSTDDRLLQVESNAIAAGFAQLGAKLTRLHQYVLNKYSPDPSIVKKALPANEADVNFPYSFILAFESYGNPDAVILFVTEDRTVNICDQRGHDFAISKIRPDIKVVRRSWTEMHSSISVSEDRRLLLDKKIEVALVYYRVLYDPKQYTGGQESWNLRLKIEISKAIKCPPIQYQMSGVKKFQEILTNRDVLYKFLPKQQADLLSTTFADFPSLDSEEEIQSLLSNPSSLSTEYVLKPQREGGGNNVYGLDIVDKLGSMVGKADERKAWILMQMIKSPIIENILVGQGVDPQSGHVDHVTGELGIFGSILASSKSVVFNHEDGHVLRSKKLGVNEAGISAGFGAIDSPLLY